MPSATPRFGTCSRSPGGSSTVTSSARRPCFGSCAASLDAGNVRLFSKILQVGLATEPLSPTSHDVVRLLHEVDDRARRLFGRALAIREVDAGSCNGCELEITGLMSPVYDSERFGVHFVASPRHADLLLVTGPVTRNMAVPLVKTYEATPAPAPAGSSRVATPSRAASISLSQLMPSWTAARRSRPPSSGAS